MRSNSTGPFMSLFSDDRAAAEHAEAVTNPSSPADPLVHDEVLSIEDLAKRFNVSTKTISRWREHGLVAQRYEVGGRKRVGF